MLQHFEAKFPFTPLPQMQGLPASLKEAFTNLVLSCLEHQYVMLIKGGGGGGGGQRL